MTLLELGAVILGLTMLARIAARFDLPTAPLSLLAGLAFGEGGIVPLVTTGISWRRARRWGWSSCCSCSARSTRHGI